MSSFVFDFKKMSPRASGLHHVYLTNHAAMCLAGVEVCLKHILLEHKLMQVDGGMSVCHKVVVTTIIWLSWDCSTC